MTRIPKPIRVALTLLVPIWVGAFIEEQMPQRWDNRGNPVTWWAGPYLITQLVGLALTVYRAISIIIDEE